jgi:phage shock protein C
MRDTRSNAVALGGVGLIALGLWWFLRSTGIVPPAVLEAINTGAGALTLIALGVVVIIVSRRGVLAAPKAGTRLYRSREDRWLGGVLGGLGAYLGIDPLLLRVAAILLTVLGAGVLIPAYIVMWIVVPEEPYKNAAVPYWAETTGWPAQPTPSAPTEAEQPPVPTAPPMPPQPPMPPDAPVPPVPPSTEA